MTNVKTRTIILLIISIIAVLITTLSITYAFQNLSAIKENAASGTGGCFQVSYSGTNLSSNDILSTIDYKESTYSTISLSKDTSCKIYTHANIYLHTNDTTTAPITTTPALRYKVIASDGYERNGLITTTNDALLATVPVTDTSASYKVYLWIDSDLSGGSYDQTSYSGYIYATSTQTSTIDTDTTPPTLFLNKESYVSGFSNWTLTNATVENNVLTLAPSTTSGSAQTPFINVNGEKWRVTFDAYTTTASTSATPNGGILVGSSYYNTNQISEVSQNTHSSNGWATSFALNTWKNDLSWDGYSGYGENIKYIKLNFTTGNQYSQPVTKIRNLKIHGQVDSSSYDITVKSTDDVNVTATKYAKGSHPANYFANSGTNVTNNKVTVTENGTYTFFVRDAAGNSNTTEIEITNIQ